MHTCNIFHTGPFSYPRLGDSRNGVCKGCGEPLCGSISQLRGCTRIKGHSGNHKNHFIGNKEGEWPNKDDEIKINLDRPDLDEML